MNNQICDKCKNFTLRFNKVNNSNKIEKKHQSFSCNSKNKIITKYDKNNKLISQLANLIINNK